MNKTGIGVLITVVAVAGIAAVVTANNKDEDQPSSTSQTSMQMESENKAGSSQDQTTTTAEVQSGTVKMDIKNFDFAVDKLKIKKGTTVTWTNQDSAKHDITPDSESADFKASELLAKGESYSFTFNTVGSFSYHCSPHPYMKANVEVVE